MMQYNVSQCSWMIRTAVGRNNNGGSNPESSESDNSDKSECSYRGQSILYVLYSAVYNVKFAMGDPILWIRPCRRVKVIQCKYIHLMPYFHLDKRKNVCNILFLLVLKVRNKPTQMKMMCVVNFKVLEYLGLSNISKKCPYFCDSCKQQELTWIPRFVTNKNKLF